MNFAIEDCLSQMSEKHLFSILLLPRLTLGLAQEHHQAKLF